MASFVKLQTAFPRITKTVRPFAGITIFFVPNKFFRPKPTLFAECQNQFKDKRVSFSILRFFFDVQDESAGWFEDAQKLFAAWDKPFHVFVWCDSAISILALIGIRWRSDNQIKCIVSITGQDIQTIAVFDFCCVNFHVAIIFDCVEASSGKFNRRSAVSPINRPKVLARAVVGGLRFQRAEQIPRTRPEDFFPCHYCLGGSSRMKAQETSAI